MIVSDNLKKLAELFDEPLYLVGGFVRNALLYGDCSGTDMDICGTMTPDEVTARLNGTEATVIPVNPRIGTVQIKFGGDEYEYTCFREDSYPVGGEHTPESVRFVKDIRVDALRRDFTVNAIYYDVKNEKVVDPTGGQADLKAGLLRTVAAPDKVFGEDGLRILRLARFAAELGFGIEAETLAAAKKLSYMLDDITPERKRIEFDKILASPEKYSEKGGVGEGLHLISELGAWEYVIPEFALKGDAAARGIAAAERAVAGVRLAALLYCVADNVEPFVNYDLTAAKSAELTRKILGHDCGLKYKDSVRSEAIRLVAISGFDRKDDATDEALRLFVQQNFVYVDKLLLLRTAIDGEVSAPIARMRFIYEDMKAHDVPYKLSDLHIRGYDVIKMGFQPNRIGEVLETVLTRSALENRRFSAEEEFAIAESLK